MLGFKCGEVAGYGMGLRFGPSGLRGQKGFLRSFGFRGQGFRG